MTWTEFVDRVVGLSSRSRFWEAYKATAPKRDTDVIDDPTALHRALMAEF